MIDYQLLAELVRRRHAELVQEAERERMAAHAATPFRARTRCPLRALAQCLPVGTASGWVDVSCSRRTGRRDKGV